MSWRSPLSGALALGIATAVTQTGHALPASAHAETAVDSSRFLYIDATSGSIHLKMSNGWRLDPWHVEAHIIFYRQGKEIARINQHVWCPASLGGHAHECNFDFSNLRSDVWSLADGIAVTGNTEAPHGGGGAPQTPNTQLN